MKNKILPIGELIKTDSRGFLKNSLKKSNIKIPWKKPVELTKQAYLNNLPKEVHSIYVRGSIAKGKAMENISDVDSFAIVKSDPNSLNISWKKEQEYSIKKQFPFVKKVEFGFHQKSRLIQEERFFPSRFTIKLMSICIYGPNLAKEIEKFKPNIETARRLQENLELFISKTKQSKLDEIKCSWIMKRFLRQGMVLVMPREKAFSRDLYICYKTFSKHYPEKEKEMRRVLELAIYPASNKKTINNILDNFGKWLIKESEAILDKKLRPEQDSNL